MDDERRATAVYQRQGAGTILVIPFSTSRFRIVVDVWKVYRRELRRTIVALCMKAKDRDKLITALRDHALNVCADTIRPVTTQADCEAASEALGIRLPPFLLRCYTEIGNGGFGPGYGLIGVGPGGHASSWGDLVTTYQVFTEPDPEKSLDEDDDDWREQLLPFCDWGCLIFSCVSCRFRDHPILTVDNNVPYPMHFTIENYFARWMHGRRVR